MSTNYDLGPRQQRFVEEYLLDLNAKQAAIRAGYSPKTAEVQGSRLLSNAKVQRVIAARMAERSKRTEVDADRALRELARVGFSDLRKVFNGDRRLKRPEEWDADTTAAVASVKVRTVKDGDRVVEVTEIRLWDKLSALRSRVMKFCRYRGFSWALRSPLATGVQPRQTLRAGAGEPTAATRRGRLSSWSRPRSGRRCSSP